jgi:hypothetical protein
MKRESSIAQTRGFSNAIFQGDEFSGKQLVKKMPLE